MADGGGALREVSAKWLLTREQLENSPSIRDGLTWEMDIEHRHRTCQIVATLAASILRDRDAELVRNVSLSGMALANRFYSRQSFKRHAKDLVAGACFYLACKLEESAVDVRSVVMCLYRHLGGSRHHPRPSEDEWAEREAAILQKEKIVMFTLEFDIAVPVPTTGDLTRIAFELVRLQPAAAAFQTKLRVLAESIVNEAFHTTLTLELTPSQLERGATILAAAMLQLPTPPKTWVENGMTGVQAAYFCNRMMELYSLYSAPVRRHSVSSPPVPTGATPVPPAAAAAAAGAAPAAPTGASVLSTQPLSASASVTHDASVDSAATTCEEEAPAPS